MHVFFCSFFADVITGPWYVSCFVIQRIRHYPCYHLSVVFVTESRFFTTFQIIVKTTSLWSAYLAEHFHLQPEVRYLANIFLCLKFIRTLNQQWFCIRGRCSFPWITVCCKLSQWMTTFPPRYITWNALLHYYFRADLIKRMQDNTLGASRDHLPDDDLDNSSSTEPPPSEKVGVFVNIYCCTWWHASFW